MRGIFFEEDDARAAAARLQADGYAAAVSRDRLAGEDDDEDHPWALVTEAPAATLELLVEQYDGWLDAGQGTDNVDRAAPPPLGLPSAPRRLHREP